MSYRHGRLAERGFLPAGGGDGFRAQSEGWYNQWQFAGPNPVFFVAKGVDCQAETHQRALALMMESNTL
jgi:hypothetical protein